MLFERFEAEGLAHFSYAVGCPAAGEIAIVDPKRDIDTYLDFAQANDVQITHILETHIHADYASGARKLAESTGATLWASGYDHDEMFEMAFTHKDLFEGNVIELGAVRIEPLHTPGHTPEHLSFLVYDCTRSPLVPMLMLSGDFLFVGSLGRPDLLGAEAKRALAVKLYHSAQVKIEHLPDGLEIHPAHGAGSLCGSGMSGRPVSTLGYERIANPYLNKQLSEEQFVEQILATVPPFPEYYKRMKKINSRGPKLLDDLPGSKRLSPEEAWGHVQEGHAVIDLRDPLTFSAGHIPGALAIGAGASVSTWASWVMPYDTPILLVVSDEESAESAVRSLIRVGLDDIRGYLCGGMETWLEAGYPVRSLKMVSPVDLNHSLQNNGTVNVLDVRNVEEWHSGHISDSIHIMAGQLLDNLGHLPKEVGQLAVVCSSGYRSMVASSLLARAGFENLVNVAGGIGAWKRAGLPLTQNGRI
ncbi:MAG TPA: MBL fold metallo-hydrolase [Candidatus Handelsmanbacteria bacterium]|nr:MBL fold metallo-hydrolase [Candidatus Handelsmanbacteria bacterium]